MQKIIYYKIKAHHKDVVGKYCAYFCRAGKWMDIHEIPCVSWGTCGCALRVYTAKNIQSASPFCQTSTFKVLFCLIQKRRHPSVMWNDITCFLCRILGCFSFIDDDIERSAQFHLVALTLISRHSFKEPKCPCRQETRNHLAALWGKSAILRDRNIKNWHWGSTASKARHIFCSAANAEVILRLIQQQPRTREHQQREGKEERERCLLSPLR